ncbi:MAG: hypothetical protein V1897_05670 [Pseudomonadota bacterium]
MSVGGIIGTLLSTVVTFIILVILNKIFEHDMEVRHSLIMSVICFFVLPMAVGAVMMFGGFSVPYLGLILPLIIWIILGEVLLGGDRKTRLKVAIIAFAVYTILSIFVFPSLFGAISSVIHF